MSKLFNPLIAFTSPHRPYCVTLRCSVSVNLWSKILKNIFFFWIFLCRNSSLTKTTDSCSSLLLISATLYVCCLRRNQRARSKLLPSIKTLLLFLTKAPNARKLCFSPCFLSFFRFFRFRFLAYWDHYYKFEGFDSLRLLKKY